jgi:hypothetical protein
MELHYQNKGTEPHVTTAGKHIVKSAFPQNAAAASTATGSLKLADMKKYWFKKHGWSYIPISITGSLITIFALLFSGWIFWEICKRTYSNIGALICFFAYFTCIAFWWKWIAESTSEKTKEP